MIRFTKMHGAGNDFVLVDQGAIREEALPGASRSLCDRKFGVGADGLLVSASSNEADVRFRMFNPDGSEAEMCGNGLRCFARRFVDRGQIPPKARIETGSGVKEVLVLGDGSVKVDMGNPELRPALIPLEVPGTAVEPWLDQDISSLGRTFRGSAVSMGNPHLVVFSSSAPDDLSTVGPALERHPWFPQRTNVHFVEVQDRSRVIQHTWERGAGITFACGTGACAVVVAGVLTGRLERRCRVVLPGGELEIEWPAGGSVLMTGPTAYVFEGQKLKND